MTRARKASTLTTELTPIEREIPCFRIYPEHEPENYIAETNESLPRDAQEKHARLMAAAPDLRNALEDLLGDRPAVQGGICVRCGRDYRAEGPMEGDCWSDDCPSAIARAALAKAGPS
jgi:hypothetical protein